MTRNHAPETAKDGTAPENEGAPKKKAPRLILIIPAVLLFVGAAGGAYFLFPPPAAPATGADDHKAKKKSAHEAQDAGAEAAALGGAFTRVGDSAFFILDPLVVSIAPMGRAKHLKIALAVETDPDAEERFLERSLRLRDAFNAYLRSVDAAVLEDPSAMASLRGQLKRRAELAVAPAPVKNVLITEFVLS